MQICQQWEGGAYSETFEDITGDVRNALQVVLLLDDVRIEYYNSC